MLLPVLNCSFLQRLSPVYSCLGLGAVLTWLFLPGTGPVLNWLCLWLGPILTWLWVPVMLCLFLLRLLLVLNINLCLGWDLYWPWLFLSRTGTCVYLNILVQYWDLCWPDYSCLGLGPVLTWLFLSWNGTCVYLAILVQYWDLCSPDYFCLGLGPVFTWLFLSRNGTCV
jgi:hypothetical protein